MLVGIEPATVVKKTIQNWNITLHDITFCTGVHRRCGSSKHNCDPRLMRRVSSDHDCVN